MQWGKKSRAKEYKERDVIARTELPGWNSLSNIMDGYERGKITSAK